MKSEHIPLGPGLSIFRRGNVWWVYCRRLCPTRRSLRIADQRTATEEAYALGSQVERVPAPVIETLQAVLDRYMLDYSPLHHRVETGKRYCSVIGMFIEMVGRENLPNAVTRQHLLDFQTQRAGEVERYTANGDLGYVKAFLNWCRAEGLLDHDPCFKVKRLKVNRSKRRTLSSDEFAEIEKAMRPTSGTMFGVNADSRPMLHDYIIVAVNTGMRPNEILHVRGCDLDASNKLLHITAWGNWQTKDAEDRTIALNLVAFEGLLQRKMGNGDDRLPLFAGRDGVIRDFKNVYHELKKKLPLSLAWVGLYDFRHFFATEAVKRGWSAEKLKVYMGHSDVSTTMKYYIDFRAVQVGPPPVIVTA